MRRDRMEQRQKAYQRRTSQHDDLEESRSRHEQFRSSMFSTNQREAAHVTRLPSRGGGGGGGAGSVDSSDGSTTAARIDAAIKAAMAVDATRGANTFNHLSITPQGSTTSLSVEGGSGGIRFTPAMAPPQGAGGGVPVVPPPVPAAPVMVGAGSRGSGSSSGGHTRGDHSGGGGGSGSGSGAYRSYHPSTGSSHPSTGSMPGLAGMSSSTGHGSTGYLSRAAASAAADESVASPSMGHPSGSSSLSGSLGGSGSGRGNGHVSGNFNGAASSAAVAAAAAVDPFSCSNQNNGAGGGGFAHAGGHARDVGSGGSEGGAQQQPVRSMWERGGGAPTPKAGWQPEPPPPPPPPPPAVVLPAGGGGHLSPGGSGGGAAAQGGGGHQHQHQHRQQSRDEDDHDHYKIDSSGALAPPDRRSPDMPPVETGSAGGSAIGHGGHTGGGGEGVEMTPTGYEPPLKPPDGCHHTSLEKFLEVMTGPGLRVRKHHRSGKGSSGLRVLRYSQEGDSLTWDSHKILGAAQHVLPMGDVENVSMQPRNQVVLMCVGGKDSYAVFEAANDDAAAVLYFGLERLRERTQARKDSG